MIVIMRLHLFIPALPESELKELTEKQRKSEEKILNKLKQHSISSQDAEEEFSAIQELGSDSVLNRSLAINIAEKNIPSLHVHRVGLSEQEIVNNCSNVSLKPKDKVIFAGMPDIADRGASCSTSLFQAANSEKLRNKFRNHAVYLAQPEAHNTNNYGGIVTEDVRSIKPFPFSKVDSDKFRNVYRAFTNQSHVAVPEAANSVFSMGDMFESDQCADNLLKLIDKLIKSK
jgi:hypothetical protein